MNILRGGKNHIGACLSIAKSLTYYFTDEAITKMAQELPKQLLFVAIDADDFVGFAGILRKSDKVAEISWIAVKANHQHQGIGSALIDHIVQDLSSQGTSLLEVKTLAENVDHAPYEITRRFYEKMGFVHLETIDPFPDWELGNPCAIYVRMLAARSNR